MLHVDADLQSGSDQRAKHSVNGRFELDRSTWGLLDWFLRAESPDSGVDRGLHWESKISNRPDANWVYQKDYKELSKMSRKDLGRRVVCA